jgi:signal transduction histidine kinase
MAAELRKTGISVVGDMPWGTHFCYFYETKQDLLDILVPYFKAGLENKEFCLWVISNSELLTVQEATSALRNALPDLDRYVAERSIEVVGHGEWFLDGGTFALHNVAQRFKEKLNEALARGYAGMRVNGSPAWLYDEDQKVFRTFEAELDKLFPNEQIIASCTYPLATIRGGEVFDAARTHQFAIARRQGAWEIIESPELIQAKAEIKRLNESLQRVKERTPKQPLILRYGVAVLSVTAILIITLWMRMKLGQLSTPIVGLFLCSVMFSAWFGGIGPGLLAIALSLLAIDYYFVTPFNSLAAEIKEIPRLIIFTLSALFVGLLSAAQRSKAESLRRARDVLDGTVQELKRTDVALRAEIAERKRAEEQLSATNVQLRALSESLRSAREQEGARIAREIHDELGAALMSLKWDLEGLDKIFTEAGDPAQLSALQEQTAAMVKLVDNTINVVRRIASELRPSILDDLGLVEAIEWQAQKFQAQTGIICQCDCALENVELGQDQSTAVFRILQEALTNILRHAQATRVDITVRTEDGQFVLTISDNGRGITEEEKSGRQSLGLLGMRERAHLVGGRIDINGKGQGTVVIVRVPLSG